MIHCFEYKDDKFCVDVESGSVHILDQLSYDVLTAMERGEDVYALNYTRADVDEAVGEIDELKADGLLFSDPEPYVRGGDTVVKALCMHMAHDCNLRCDYCFGGTGSFHKKRELMSLDTAKAAVDFLMRASGARKNLEIDFFGGEPLLNFDVVKQTVAYGREQERAYGKTISFTITTNAYDITDDMLDFLDQMKNVVISVDGRKEIHDAHRKTVGGTGSFDRVVENAGRIVERRGEAEHYVRATFTRDNLDFAADVAALADAGFKHISVEPVVTRGKMALRAEDMPRIAREYDRLAGLLDERPELSFFHFTVDLDSGPCVLKRIRGCGAGSEYAAVAPSGDIYPCHQFVGMDEFKLGDVYSGVTNKALVDRFERVNIYEKTDCRGCWVKYYCSGGCAANAYNTTGDIMGTYALGCEMAKKRIEIAIAREIKSDERP